jgi:hypothetical protein
MPSRAAPKSRQTVLTKPVFPCVTIMRLVIAEQKNMLFKFRCLIFSIMENMEIRYRCMCTCDQPWSICYSPTVAGICPHRFAEKALLIEVDGQPGTQSIGRAIGTNAAIAVSSVALHAFYGMFFPVGQLFKPNLRPTDIAPLFITRTIFQLCLNNSRWR